MLTTLLKPTSGKAIVAGYDVADKPEKFRKPIGVALQKTGIEPGLTGRELLTMQARLFGFNRRDSRTRTLELLELVGLEDNADRLCRKYFGNYVQRD